MESINQDGLNELIIRWIYCICMSFLNLNPSLQMNKKMV